MNYSHIHTGNMHFYAMEPGDGTLYRFGFVDFHGLARDVWSGSFGHVFSGVGSGEWYVGVLIDMPSGQGFYPLRRDSIGDPQSHFVSYTMNHMPGVRDRYTVAAILLALSVLVDNPTDYQAACREMLRAPEILGGF